HRGDDRLAHGREPIPLREQVFRVDLGEGLRRHLLDVGAGGERLLRAREQDRTDLAVRVEFLDGGDDLTHQLAVEGVERLRPVEGDDDAAALAVEQNGLEIGHWLSFAVERSRMSVMMAEKSSPPPPSVLKRW